MSEVTTVTAGAGVRHKRKLRNFLLDARFQLKYSGYLVAITLVLSLSLGLVLWRTSEAVLAQSQEAVAVGEQVVARGREVVGESKKVSAVVQMNIVKDPVYSDSPALLEAFQHDARQQDERLDAQQRQLEQQSLRLKEQSIRLESQQRTIGTALTAILGLLVVGVGLGGIVVTHKVAGPIYKMKRQLRALAGGDLQIPPPLRKGDELVEFFDEFNRTVQSLRERQEAEIAQLDRAIANLEQTASPEALEELRALRRDMQAALDT